MRSILLCLWALLASAALSFGQSKQAVYLKNGSIIIGQVQSSPEKVTVISADGSVWMFDWDEVDRVDQPPKESRQHTKGWTNMTGLMFYTGTYTRSWDWGETTDVMLSPGLYSFTGYTFSRPLTLGLGFGVDGYSEMALVPVTVGWRGEILPSHVTLYYGLDVGYAFPWSRERGDEFWWERHRGGVVVSPMIGLKRYGPRGDGFFLQAGWRTQSAHYEEWSNGWAGPNYQTRRLRYNRLQFGFGLFF
jgi:hypothetical protein